MIGIGFGSICGLIFFGKRNFKICWVDREDERWWFFVVRLLVTLLICGVVMLPYLLLSIDSISNIYVLMIIKTLIPTFAAGFILFCGLLEHIFLRMKVLRFKENQLDQFSESVVNDG